MGEEENFLKILVYRECNGNEGEGRDHEYQWDKKIRWVGDTRVLNN